jgi:hypothetical protein
VSNEEINRALATDDTIVPSSGFASSVMEAVRRDTDAPPPIPFPWKRALPGFIVCLAGAGLLAANDRGAGWMLVALLVAALSVLLSMRQRA